MNAITVVGLDPSFRNFGMVRAAVQLDTLEVLVTGMQLIETEKGAQAGKKVRMSSDHLRRARDLRAGISEFLRNTSMVMAEVPAGAQSANAAFAFGVCTGVMASIDRPLIEVSNKEVKLAGYGVASATKEEMIGWAVAKHPEAPWPMKKSKGELVPIAGSCEHLADALATIYAGLKTQQFAQARDLMRSMARTDALYSLAA